MVIINKEEIVEISADLLGRVHCCEDIKLRPLGERREDIREHIRLDLRCKLQLCSYTFLFLSYLGYILDILSCLGGKVCKALREHLHLIARSVSVLHFKGLVGSDYRGHTVCHLLYGANYLISDRHSAHRADDKHKCYHSEGYHSRIIGAFSILCGRVLIYAVILFKHKLGRLIYRGFLNHRNDSPADSFHRRTRHIVFLAVYLYSLNGGLRAERLGNKG